MVHFHTFLYCTQVKISEASNNMKTARMFIDKLYGGIVNSYGIINTFNDVNYLIILSVFK